MLLLSQRPGTGVYGLKDYKRSRYGQAATNSAANTLLPQPIPDLELDDTVVQVRVDAVLTLVEVTTL